MQSDLQLIFQLHCYRLLLKNFIANSREIPSHNEVSEVSVVGSDIVDGKSYEDTRISVTNKISTEQKGLQSSELGIKYAS